ncbi:MAG: hypothetical protein ABJB74_04400 [Gemmatimonas sp.]
MSRLFRDVATGVLLAIGIVPLNAIHAQRVRDSVATHARLVLSITEFQAAWQRAWRESETTRQQSSNGAAQLRLRTTLVHCHPTERDSQFIQTYWYGDDDVVRQKNFQFAQITGKNSMFAACPTWLFADPDPPAQDERFGRDAALLEEMRVGMHDSRALLLSELDVAANNFPNDGWISGQRVRFWFDQNDVPSATAAAESCQGEKWWCAALRGYAHARINEIAPAEREFREMHLAMSLAQQCEWDDVRDLLLPSERNGYTALPCVGRIAATTKLWWLSDPLLRVQGNERQVEHNVRRVEIALHSALDQDERYSWNDRFGGDVLATLVLRYGWPGYTGWGGDYIDDDHTDYLETRSSPRTSPYTTFEYSIDRVHTLPPLSVVASPFTAPESSWSMSPDDISGHPYTEWWPVEHFRTRRRLVQLPEGQNAMFRRENGIRVAATVTLSHPMLRDGAPLDVMMVSSPDPLRVDSVSRRSIRAGTIGVMQGMINSAPTVIAVEAIGTGARQVDARARFGIVPPPTLEMMRRGDIAVSDPVLLDVQHGKVNVDSPSDSLIDQMLNTVHLDSRTRRVGVYWETYGIASTDTVTVSVRVATDEGLSAMRRLGIALNLAENPNREVVQRWTEPDARRGSKTGDGRVPVGSHAIVLNLGLLQPDSYVIEVTVERRDGSAATGRRRITIER